MDQWQLIMKNLTRRIGRSFSCIFIFAAGSYLVLTLTGYKKSIQIDPKDNSNGTGGYHLFCQLTNPLKKDDLISSEKFEISRHRLKAGDDSSCLNLTQAQNPQILSIDTQTFTKRNSFSFQAILPQYKHFRNFPWELLNQQMNDHSIPVILDHSVMQWGLNKKIGEHFEIQNDSGKIIKLKIIATLKNSIFQGFLLMNEHHFLKNFHQNPGYKILLIDSQSIITQEQIKQIKQSFILYGMDIITTQERLLKFFEIENTYLSIFSLLGALGLIIGTFGLSACILRNILERTNEFKLLKSLGFKNQLISKHLIIEHIILIITGLLIAVLSTGIALIPVIVHQSHAINFTQMFHYILIMLIFGFINIKVTIHFMKINQFSHPL